jgi:hypothetical protein
VSTWADFGLFLASGEIRRAGFDNGGKFRVGSKTAQISGTSAFSILALGLAWGKAL